MLQATKDRETACPIARALHIVGDRWSVLILRELSMGTTRFEALQIQTEATPQMLTTRLKSLEAHGMIERHPYREKPLRHEYRLTEKGTSFYPVLHALRAWGETWCKDESEEAAVSFVHRQCGRDVGLASICPKCVKPIQRSDLDATISERYARERSERRAAFRQKKQPNPEARPVLCPSTASARDESLPCR